jgi:hypothetical protein
MSLFQNKFFVAGMVAAAIATIGYSLGLPMWKKHRATKNRPPTTAATGPSASVSQVQVQDAAGRNRQIDRLFVAQHFEEWLLAPRRDPFAVHGMPGMAIKGLPPASEFLKLEGIWRQTGSRLAVINRQIVREGDSMSHFIIEQIDADAVWVRGPSGPERLRFSNDPVLRPDSLDESTDSEDPDSDPNTVAFPLPTR